MIRLGEEKDIPRCLEMAEDFYHVAGYEDHISYDSDSCDDYFKLSLSMGLFSVAVADEELVGFILGLAMPHIMNKNYLVGTELAWWVEPEYRKGTTGLKLLAHIEKCAKEKGCVLWSMMSLETQDPEKVDKLYLSKGYERAERTYMRVL